LRDRNSSENFDATRQIGHADAASRLFYRLGDFGDMRPRGLQIREATDLKAVIVSSPFRTAKS
jgi:hypothetical protein